ncbi:hypothetical protein MACH17_33400 [Phaeobacter inhibens]|nr:hypothetical protein MACH17_33400 [Phaeobacter inhibens]
MHGATGNIDHARGMKILLVSVKRGQSTAMRQRQQLMQPGMTMGR